MQLWKMPMTLSRNSRCKWAKNFPDRTTADDVISTDDNLLSTEPLLTDDQIIDIIMGEEIVDDALNDDDDGDASGEQICPKATDERNALEGFREYMLLLAIKADKIKDI